MVLLAASFLLSAGELSAQDVSVRGNLLYGASGTPNVGFEYPVSNHFSVGFNAALKPWPRFFFWDVDTRENTSQWKHFLVAPELRYYLDEIYGGTFLGTDLVYTHYNVGNVNFPFGLYKDVREHRLQGDFFGVGVFAGYSWWIADNWRLEAEAGIALGGVFQSRYDCTHCGTKLGNENKVAAVPKLGVNIAYNLLPRETEKPQPPLPPEPPERPSEQEPLAMPALFVPVVSNAAAPPTAGDRLAAEVPWVLPASGYMKADKLPRPHKDSLLYVHFPLGRTELLRDFPKGRDAAGKRSNGIILDSMVVVMRRILADPRCDIKVVQIIGLASFEGPYNNNVKLGDGRAAALKAYLKRVMGLDDDRFEAVGKGEAWDWFRAQMEDFSASGGRGLSAAQVRKIIGIVDSEADPERRERLLKADKALYAVLRDSILADQRNSGYVRTYFENKPDPATEERNLYIAEVRSGRFSEVAEKAGTDPSVMELLLGDAESKNALAASIFIKAVEDGDRKAQDDALSLLRQAADAGSAAAETNLSAAEEYLSSTASVAEENVARRHAFEREMSRYYERIKTYNERKAEFDIEYERYARELARYNRRKRSNNNK